MTWNVALYYYYYYIHYYGNDDDGVDDDEYYNYYFLYYYYHHHHYRVIRRSEFSLQLYSKVRNKKGIIPVHGAEALVVVALRSPMKTLIDSTKALHTMIDKELITARIRA